MTDLINPVAAADKPAPKRANTNAKYSKTGEKKKQGRMKRIRGFLTGESRKERRERKAKERAAAGKSALEGSFLDDDESVYCVDIDNISVARSMVPAVTAESSLLEMNAQSEESEYNDMAFLSPKPIAPALQVILLLMDPKTRRFELLQLEFDSNKALVSDVLAQIPLSVTEEQLRKQQYQGVCDRSGLEMIKTMRLSEFCKTNDVVLAIPDAMSGKECARLSRPILSDEGVITMLRASGIDTKPAPPSPSETCDLELSSSSEEKLKDKTTSKSWALIVVLFIAILLQAAQMYITAPLKPGHVLSPGMWMSKCGLLSPLPACQNSGLEMNEDGVLTLYGSDGSVQWRLVGGKCHPDSDCIPGLVVKDDGNLVIGGKAITSVTITGDAPLSPWPFEMEPKLRVVRK